ncbi:MAG TPA: tripartite tricarboxylate transporter substrate binding protein [Burkholderiales bacterium]|nr:tripartite tricarboxylate transporter substrate binding protein [Burkholderiales bacterium]
MSKYIAASLGVSLATAVAIYVPAVAAASFPERPIELIVPFAPGGGSGITAELMKKIITDHKLSAQPVSLTYKPGASGQVGWTHLATRKREGGYVIATATASFNTGFVFGKQVQIKPADFTPIALMLTDTALLVTQPNSKFKTMKDVIEAAKQKPDSVRISGTGATGGEAIGTALINDALKIRLNYIPFNSGGEAAAALLGGHVELTISNPNELVPHIEAKKMVPLAVMSRQRLSIMKDVPTMMELGYNVVYDQGRGVVAPAGIPEDHKKALVEMMRKITQTKEWAEYAQKNAMSVTFLDSAQYAKYLDEERAKLEKIAKTLKPK